MKKAVLKKDILTNYKIYLAATFSLILLILVLTEGYPRFIDQYREFVVFISALAGILLGIGGTALLVYVLINNAYSDVQYKLIDEKTNIKNLIYYRVFYATTSGLYFIAVALITVVVTTEVTWQDVMEFFTPGVILAIINGFIVLNGIFFLVMYKLYYEFKIPKLTIVATALLIISLLITLYAAINITFLVVCVGTVFSILFLLLINVSLSYKTTKWYYHLIDLLIVAIAAFAIGNVYMNSNEYLHPGNGENYQAEQHYKNSYPLDLISEQETEYGKLEIYSADSGFYSFYINNGTGVYYKGQVNDKFVHVEYYDSANMKSISFDYNSEVDTSYNIWTNYVDKTNNEFVDCSDYNNVDSIDDIKDDQQCLTDQELNDILNVVDIVTQAIPN